MEETLKQNPRKVRACGKMICGKRNSKYVRAVYAEIENRGHATNSEILEALQKDFPNLSATTVHRITARMLGCGRINLAPNGPNQTMRFDAVTEKHGHFVCKVCRELTDIDFAELWPDIETRVNGSCAQLDDLVASGICKHCYRKKELEKIMKGGI